MVHNNNIIEKPNIKLKDLSNIKREEIDAQIKIRQYLIQDMVGNLYPSVLDGEIKRLRIMKQYPVDTKVEGGFLYFKLKGEWEIAGRDDHPLSSKFIEETKKQFYDKKINTS